MRKEYGFRHYLHNLGRLLQDAKSRGITISSWPRRGGKRIFIRHFTWEAGVHKKKPVIQGFVTYREALRSFDHTIGSILMKSVFTQDLKGRFEEFGRRLRTSHSDQAKTNFVEDILPELLLPLVGRRTGNLFEIRERLREEEGELQKSVLELVDDSNWGAVCSVVVMRFGNLLNAERRRIVDEIRPRVEERELILGRIWEHQKWYAQRFEDLLAPFVEEAERARRAGGDGLNLTGQLRVILYHFWMPYPMRLVDARNALQYVLNKLETRTLDRGAQRAWRSALTNVRQEHAWLLQEDKQLKLFKGAA